MRNEPRAGLARLFLALGALCAPAAAGVIVVDPAGGGDFTTLFAAVAAAADGDTVLISPSSPCTGCELGGAQVDGKSLTIVFDTSAASPADFPVGSLVISGLASGETLVLRGLQCEQSIILWLSDGAIWVEDCVVTGTQGTGTGLMFPCSAPAGYGAGAPAIGVQMCAAVTIVDCTLQGGVGADASSTLHAIATDGGSGLSAQSASVAVFGSTLTGGKGGAGQICVESPDGGAGVQALVDAHVLLSGCTLQGGEPTGAPPGTPGPGLRGVATASFELLDSSVTPWPGGVAFDTAPGTLITYPGAARRFTLSSPLREGEGGTLTLQGVQGDFVGFFWSFGSSLIPKPGKNGWFLLGPPFISGPYFIGVITNPDGSWTLPITAPSLVPTLEEQTFLLQAYFAYPGGATLSSGTAFTLLDASL